MWPTALRPNAAFGSAFVFAATTFERGLIALPVSDAVDCRCGLVCSEGVEGQDFSGSGSAFDTSCFRSLVGTGTRLPHASFAISTFDCRESRRVVGRVVKEAAFKSDADVAKGVRDCRKEPLECSAIFAYGLDLSAERERDEERIPRVLCVGVLGVLGVLDAPTRLLFLAGGAGAS